MGGIIGRGVLLEGKGEKWGGREGSGEVSLKIKGVWLDGRGVG